MASARAWRAAALALALGAGQGAPAALAQSAEAPSPPVPYAGIAPGATFRYVFSDGFVTFLRLDEKTAEGSRWALLPESPDSPPAAFLLYDAHGRQTAYLDAAGEVEESYDPHNCERVQGECDYVLTNAEGVFRETRRAALLNPEDYARRDTALDLEWIYEISRRTEGGGVEEREYGTIRYDAEGLVLEQEWFKPPTGEEDSYRRAE